MTPKTAGAFLAEMVFGCPYPGRAGWAAFQVWGAGRSRRRSRFEPKHAPGEQAKDRGAWPLAGRKTEVMQNGVYPIHKRVKKWFDQSIHASYCLYLTYPFDLYIVQSEKSAIFRSRRLGQFVFLMARLVAD
jgi:hypothetical protein